MLNVNNAREAVSAMVRIVLTSRRFWSLMLVVAAFFMVGQFVEAERPLYGSLVKSRGVVEYRAAGTTKWITATERQRVSQGDRFKTGADGEVVIKLSNRNLVSVRSNSEVTINMATTQSSTDENNMALGLFPARTQVQNMEVGLDRGRAINVMKGLRANSQFRMATPVAVAGVRGTVFLAEVLPPGDARRGQKQSGANTLTNFSCIEGSLNVNPTALGGFDPTIVPEGQGFSIGSGPDGAPIGSPDVSPVPSNVVEEVTNAVDPTLQADPTGGPEPPSQPDPVTSSDNVYCY